MGQAQEDGKIVLKGVVQDARTNEPIPFVNIGLLGTVAGVASDVDGRFELVIPDRYATHVLRLSAIGYASKDIKVYEIQNKPDLKILLQPKTYGIGEVDVYGQLLIYKKMSFPTSTRIIFLNLIITKVTLNIAGRSTDRKK